MRLAPVFLFSAAFLALTLSPPTGPLAQELQDADIEVLVTVGLVPLPGASVVLDLNNNGVWDEDLGEPIQWTDGNGMALFGNVVSIQDPGQGEPEAYGGCWNHTARLCRSAYRYGGHPSFEYNRTGIRPVRTAF